MFIHTRKFKGFLMAIIGAVLWGLSGTVAQDLFQAKGVSMSWLVTARLLFSGMILITFALLTTRQTSVWDIWKQAGSGMRIVIFGLIGMLGVQYTYFASIETGNAAVATLLQFLAPVYIVLFFVLRYKVWPRFLDFIAILLALTGTVLLLTNGSFGNMTVSTVSIIWGVASGISLAFYTLYAGDLLKKWGSPIVVGWGMLIGGISMSFIHPPWKINITSWSVETTLLIIFVLVFGTLLAFYLFIESLRHISAKETCLLGCIEPVVSVVSSVIFLKISFGFFQILGTFSIIIMVILLSLAPQKEQTKDAANDRAKAS